MISMPGSGKKLEEFSYTDLEMANMIHESMQEVQFQGMSSFVQFDETGSNNLNIQIEQQQGELPRIDEIGKCNK